jgi:hypothetical protein
VKKWLTHVIMLDSLILAYAQFLVMLIELQEVTRSGIKVFVLQDYHSLTGTNGTRSYRVSLLKFYCIRNK